jgi:hypothetical protein
MRGYSGGPESRVCERPTGGSGAGAVKERSQGRIHSLDHAWLRVSSHSHNTLDGVRAVLGVLEEHRGLMAQTLKSGCVLLVGGVS